MMNARPLPVVKVISAGCAVLMLGLGVLTGCTRPTVAAGTTVPSLPASYYDSIETYPPDLERVYFGYYPNAGLFAGSRRLAVPRAKYDNRVYVFKDQVMDAWAVRDVARGWLWLDNIKCPLVNLGEMKSYRLGDHFDLVGLNLGPVDEGTPVLLFQDCYVLPAGFVKLPAGDSTVGQLGY